MKEYGINIDPKAIAGRLSVAEQQMAEILKVLLKSPELIILDEPTSSLAIQEVEKLFQIIRNLVEKGKTILFISHRMEEIFEIRGRRYCFQRWGIYRDQKAERN